MEHPALSTGWTMVLKAHSPVADEREAAWKHLVGTYGAPVSAYFRSRGIALRLGMNPGSVRNAHQLFRQQFRDILRQAVAATVGSVGEIDEEIAYLRSVFAR